MGPGLMNGRHLVVVDVESTGLDPARHVPVEVAAINVTTGEELYFVPQLTSDQLGAADPRAMQINRYYERGLFARAMPFGETRDWDRLFTMLQGNTLAGANPRFDAAMLVAGYASEQRANGGYIAPEESWHFRLADLSAYTAGVLGLDPTDLPGLDRCCELCGVANEAPHTAMGDARATVACFQVLAGLAADGGVQ